MDKPSVAIFTGNYNHIRDGVSNTLNRAVEHLEKGGHRVIVFGPKAPVPALEHKGSFYPVRSMPAPARPEYRISLGFPSREKKRLRAFAPDLIHIATPDILGYGALRYALKHRITVVASYHTHFTSYLKYYRLNRFEKWLWAYLSWFYGHCRHLYVPTESMMEDLERLGVKTDMRIWSRGVDTRLFNPDKRDDEWRRKNDFEPDHVVVSFVSRLVWEKNLHIVAETFQKLKEMNPAIRTMVVGDGPAGSEFRQMIPDTFFTGHLEGEDLARAYASSDLFFFPSETESFGNVTLEAMSCGLPAVVADAIGSRSIVDSGRNGMVVPADDSEAFAQAIDRIARDGMLRKKMSSGALSKARKQDWEYIMQQLSSHYAEVLSRDDGTL